MAYYFFNIWQTIRSHLPGACGERTELNPFAKGQGNETEMASYRHYEGTDEGGAPRIAGTEDYDGEVPVRKASGAGEFEGEFGSKGSKIDEWQAGWNVTNAIQGMFIVSLPYAVLYGGYWAVFSLAFVAYICCHTGKILVACLYELNDKGEMERVRDSYVDIAQSCLGERYGGKMVNCAQIIELLMTCILYVVLCGDLMIGSFPEGPIDQRSWMMISTMFLLPCAFLKKLTAVSWLSFWCTMAHVLINVIILGFCLIKAPEWQWSKVTFSIDGSMFPVTLGIVVFSYTSQIFLPSLEGNMKDRSKFHCMLDWSHIAAAAFKAGFAWLAFLTFGEETQEVITNNLPTKGFKVIVNLILVIKALLSYPLPYFAAANLLESALFQGQPKTKFPSCLAQDGELRIWAVALRVLLVIFTMLLAITIPHFAILMGLIGSFTGTMLSFVWPCYFHMKLKRNDMTRWGVAWETFIICMGVSCGVVGIYSSAKALVAAYHIPLPYPQIRPT
ncbi:vesicular inhibitory amino acid transporter [Trichonephila clavata]|uniref:Vesicular inhibitory amino acid transporter n=1 Tax=Trichonephila clavata TaxID=2740835 RepID=A0A8X6K8D6_TRICU|nr:vesicular inhibitory amino acid transporter [Trichonephila clavata]